MKHLLAKKAHVRIVEFKLKLKIWEFDFVLEASLIVKIKDFSSESETLISLDRID